MNISSSILIQMTNIIKRKVFLLDENQEKIIRIFSRCYAIYRERYKTDGKLALDTIYNLSNLLNVYYNELLLNDKIPNEQFKELKEKFKNNKLNEIRTKWRVSNKK